MHYRRTERHTEKAAALPLPLSCVPRGDTEHAWLAKYCAPAHNARVHEQEDRNRQQANTSRPALEATRHSAGALQLKSVRFAPSSVKTYSPRQVVVIVGHSSIAVQYSSVVAVLRVSRQCSKLPSSHRAS